MQASCKSLPSSSVEFCDSLEIGYMFARGKPLSGWTTDPRDYPAKVAAYLRDAWAASPRPRAALGAGGTSGTTTGAPQ